MSEEVPLSGGRVTPGVTRVADTVRRPSNPNSPLVRELLRQLERAVLTRRPVPSVVIRAGLGEHMFVPSWVHCKPVVNSSGPCYLLRQVKGETSETGA